MGTGPIYWWSASDVSTPLRRQLFTSYYTGKAWHSLAGVRTDASGEGLIGLMVDPTNQNTCKVMFWPPQAVLASPDSTVIETAPLARVLPQNGNAGTLVPIHIRLWDAEGNDSTPFLQVQLPDATNWQEVAIAFLDGTTYSPALKVQALPGGSEHVLVCNASALLTNTGTTNLWFRTRARDMALLGDWSEPMPYGLTVTPDSDGDGLPDAWEMQYFKTLAYGPLDDPDHDGMNNLAEYLAGTDPTDPKSKLALDIHVVGNEVRVSWPATTNATQYLQSRYNLDQSNGSWIDLRTNLTQVPNSGGYTDQLSTNPARFYRLRLEK